MIDDLIGNGNLPNVYFNNIEVYNVNNVEGNEKTIAVKLTLSIKDKKVNGKFQWADNNMMSEFLVIKLLQSTSPSFSALLTEGEYTLTKSDYKNSSVYTSAEVKEQTLRLRLYNDSKVKMIGLDENNNEIYCFYYDFEFYLKESDATNLTYFANVSINMNDLGNQYAADFSSDLLSLYQGPVSSEKVFNNGQLVEITNKMLFSDLTQYGGAAHYTEQNGWMAGPFHTTNPHPQLLLSEVVNRKLKDLRVSGSVTKALNTEITVKPYLLEGSSTHDQDGRIKKIYFLNYDSLFTQKTKYGNLLKQIDPVIYNEALTNFKIKKLTILRNKIKVTKNSSPFAKLSETVEILPSSSKIMGITKDIQPYELSSSINSLSIISEIPPNDNKVRFISFTDEEATNLIGGKFNYTIKIDLIDNTIDFLNSKYAKFSLDIKALESYYLRSSKPSNYNAISGKFSNEFKTVEDDFFNVTSLTSAETIPWVIAVENYGDLYRFMNIVDIDKIDKIKESTFDSINPQTGNPSSILKFIQEYRDLLKTYAARFDLAQTIQGSAFHTSPSSRVPVLKNLIKISFTGKDYIDFSTTRTGYRVMPERPRKPYAFEPAPNVLADSPRDIMAQPSPPMMLSEYKKRKIQEKNRFFKNTPSLTANETKNISRQEKDSFQDIETSAPSFMSPIGLFNNGKKIDLSRAARADSPELNKMITKISRANKKSKKFLSKKVKFLKPISIQPLDLPPKKNIDATDYLGPQTKFSNVTQTFQLIELNRGERFKTSQKIKNSLDRKLKKKITKNFDLTKENNVIFKKMRRKTIDIEKQLKEIPMHLKAIVASRSDTVKTNFLDSSTDVLSSDETDNKFLITHFLVQEMQFLNGFQLDKSGEPIISAPLWETISNDVINTTNKHSVICRMINYVDEEINLDVPDEINLPIFDSTFVVENDINPLPPQPPSLRANLLIGYNNTNDVNYDYCTSNIIKQSPKQNGFLNQSTIIPSTSDNVAENRNNQQPSLSSNTGQSSAPSSGRSY
jgi:hypothetical protein